MNRLMLVLSLLASSLVAVAPARGGVLVEPVAAVNLSFDPFSGFSSAASLRLTVENDGPADVGATVRIRPVGQGGWVLRGPAGELPLQLSHRGSGPAAGELAIPTQAPAGRSIDIEVSAAILAPNYADAGRYVLDLEVAASAGLGLPEGVRIVRISADVPPRAQASVAGTQAAFDASRAFAMVDFGALESGERRDFFLQLRANTDARMEITSENRGRMVLDGAPNAPSLPYRLEIDGVAADLGSRLELVRRPNRSLAGSSYRGTITLGDASSLFAGQYRDMIQIDVYPQ